MKTTTSGPDRVSLDELSRTEDDRLEARTIRDGRAWAEAVRAALDSEGRPATGGWPGTLSEAQAKMKRDANISPSRRAQLARVFYASARAFWMNNRVRQAPDPG